MLQANKTSDKYKALLESAVQMLEKRGYEDIRADFDDYDSPAKLKRTDSDGEYVPDLTALMNDRKCYFEIANKNLEDKEKVVSKWKLLSTLAKFKDGSFYLLVPHGNMKFTKEILKEYEIEAEVMKINLN